jgi:23S rRNA pseudouridine955/2504/2580 synthase/23S rRNA pseudouridine1911/1915/1917 synthase
LLKRKKKKTENNVGKIKWEIIQENEQWLAVNKPAGLLSVPDREQSEPSLKDLLQERYGKIWTVHRLDKPTSGILIYARTESSHQWLSKQFEERKVDKIYYGLVSGTPVHPSGMIDMPIMEHPGKPSTYITHAKGKPSQTSYEVISSFGSYSWLKFQLHTGRTHQIRVHLQYLGNPLAADELYSNSNSLMLSSIKRKKFKLSLADEEEKPLLSRLALHAASLSFTDQRGIVYNLEVPLPKDLTATLKQLEKWSRKN